MLKKPIQLTKRKSSLLQKNPIILQLLKQQVKKLQQVTYQQNLQQLQKQFGLKKINKNTQTYTDLRYYLTQALSYPNRQLAQIHRNSNKLGKNDKISELTDNNYTNNKQQTLQEQLKDLQCCPCCGFKIQQEQLKICSDKFKDVPVIGISTYLYFKTIKNIIFLLSLSFLIFGIYSLITNIIVSNSISQYFNNTIKTNIDILTISLGSKIYLDQIHQKLLIPQVWLGCLMVLIFIIVFVIMEQYQFQATTEIQKLSKSASDYSIIMDNLPVDITYQELSAVFNQIIQESTYATNYSNYVLEHPQEFKVVKINIGKPIKVKSQLYNQFLQQSQKYLQQVQEYQDQIISWIEQLKQKTQFTTPKQIRNQQIQSFKQLKQKICEHNQKYVQIIKNQYKKKQKQLVTQCFITFSSIKAKQLVLKSLQYSPWDNFLMYFTLFIYTKQTTIKIRNQLIKVKIQSASQPQDINWQNIGIKTSKLIKRKLITFTLTFILLALSFGVVYGLTRVQISNQQNYYISILISIFISIFNIIIVVILRLFTIYQHNLTQTEFQSSLAIKTILVQLLNTIVIPILVNVFLKPKQYIYQRSGLAENVFLLGLTNALISPIFKIIDFYYLYVKYLQPWLVDKPLKKMYMNQLQLNKDYQLMEFQNGIEYIYLITLYLFTCFFMSLQPIIIFFAIIGLILHFWASKYSLFNRCKRPVPGTKILYDTTVQFVYAGGLFYGLGSLTFINLLPQDLFQKKINSTLIANLISIGLGTIAMIIPFSWLYNIFSNKQQYDIKNELYQQNRIFFPSQYDRLNPSTSQKSILQYLSFIDSKKKQISNNQQLRQKILDQFKYTSKNNYNKEIINPLGGLFNNMFIDGVINPKIEIIHPKFVFNHLIGEEDSQFGYNQDNYGEKNQNNQNNHNNQNYQNIQNNHPKNGWLDALMNNKNNQIQNIKHQQNAKSSQRLYTGIQLTKQSLNHLNSQQKLPFNQRLQPLHPKNSLIQYVADNIQFSALDPLKNKIYYGYSPYNSKQLQAFKSLGSYMIRQKRKLAMKNNGNVNQEKVENGMDKNDGLGY